MQSEAQCGLFVMEPRACGAVYFVWTRTRQVAPLCHDALVTSEGAAVSGLEARSKTASLVPQAMLSLTQQAVDYKRACEGLRTIQSRGSLPRSVFCSVHQQRGPLGERPNG